MSLQNLALNWALAGQNVIYISLELSEELCSMRLDSMLTGMNTRDVFKNADDVDLKVRMQGKDVNYKLCNYPMVLQLIL